MEAVPHQLVLPLDPIHHQEPPASLWEARQASPRLSHPGQACRLIHTHTKDRGRPCIQVYQVFQFNDNKKLEN